MMSRESREDAYYAIGIPVNEGIIEKPQDIMVYI